MEYLDSSAENALTDKELEQLEENRLNMLSEAGISEGDVLEQARRHISSWMAHFDSNIIRGKSDLEFVLQDQWQGNERSEFQRLQKTALTFNKLRDTVKKIAGEQRQNKPNLMVRARNSKVSQEQIDWRTDLVRTIAYQSQNDLVYQSAFRSALMMGYGAFQITLEYETPKSFFQIPRYNICPDPSMAMFDPTALMPHKGDGNFCALYHLFSKEEFYATYPYIGNATSYKNPNVLPNYTWNAKDSLIVADYYVKEWFPLIIYKISDGETTKVVTEEEWEKIQKAFSEQLAIVNDLESRAIIEKMRPQIIAKRQTQDYEIMHYRMTRDQIVDFSRWPSKHLPIIFVDGDSQFVDGKQRTSSFVHDAKDAQRFMNYVGSEIATEIKNRRREQWIATPENIVGNEQMWRNPETQMGALIATPDPKTGQMPQRMSPWDLSPALMQNFQRASQDIREILGFSETEALQGRDMSGKARRERKMEGSMSAYVYFDNLNQAIEQGGRVILDLLPYVIGTDERNMILSKSDGKTQSMTFNQRTSDGKIQNVLDHGEYDIEIDTGPSFAVQRDIALEFLQQTLQAFPQSFPLIADLWAKNLDVQFMPEMAERFKSMVPPEILAKEEGNEPPPKQPNPQELMQQQQMQEQQQKMQLNEQKMQIEAQQLAERAEELKIRKEKHELDKLELLLKTREMSQKASAEEKRTSLDAVKADNDYSAKIAKLIADLHKNSTDM
jgi:hypothetical protein